MFFSVNSFQEMAAVRNALDFRIVYSERMSF